MTVIVTMRGLLEPVEVENDFVGMANDLNIAAASGKAFVVARSPEGENMALQAGEILVIKEKDEF